MRNMRVRPSAFDHNLICFPLLLLLFYSDISFFQVSCLLGLTNSFQVIDFFAVYF